MIYYASTMTRGFRPALVLISLLCVAVGDFDVGVCSDSTVDRGRNSLGCSSVDCFIELVKKLEQGALPTNPKEVATYLHKLSDDHQPSWMCGEIVSKTKVLTDGEITILENMIGHNYHYKNGTETGVALTRDGTVALGHVIAGIDCGGYNRDTDLKLAKWYEFMSPSLDNLFVSTISRVIAETTLTYYSDTEKYSLFGPVGTWDNPSCPRVYKIKSKDTRMTNAEVLGDIDGFVLGTVIGKMEDKTMKLSVILSKYYQGDGINVGGREYSSANRAVTFAELVSEKELTAQSSAYAEWHYKLNSDNYGAVKKSYLLRNVPTAVNTFFETYTKDFEVGCSTRKYARSGDPLDCSVTKHSVDCFIELVEKLEKDISARKVAVYLRKLGYDDKYWTWMCGLSITSLTLGEITSLTIGEKTRLTNMIHHKYHYQRGKKGSESGVALTRHGTVALGHVIAGIDCGGYNRDTALSVAEWYGGASFFSSTSSHLDNLFVSTISGDMGQTTLAYYSDTTEYSLFSPKGNWDNPSCPRVYKIKSKDTRMTHAEVLGDIDGFVLGTIIGKMKDKTLKLSVILSKYYQGDGINVDGRKYSSANRAVTFAELVSEKVLTAQSLAYAELHYKQHSSSYGAAKRSDLLNNVPAAVKEFFKTYIQVDGYKSEFLPDYKTLVTKYPGGISGDALRKKLTGNLKLNKVKTLAATDGLRLSYMLNQLDGHHIPKTQSHGAFVGTDNNVYIFDLAALKTYLTKTYKDPPQTAQSVATFKGKQGIMMLDVSQSDGSAGSVGLWDGKKMHQITDYTKSTSVKVVTFWKMKGCTHLAEMGNCEFYKCVDNAFPCQDKGYALGYGYRYCKKFTEHYNKFTPDGQTWVKTVRKCVMEAIAPYYKGMQDCDTIKRIAFDSHVDCYEKSWDRFCKMVLNGQNSDALLAIYEFKDVDGADAVAASKQVWDTSKYCSKVYNKNLSNKRHETDKDGYKKRKRSIRSTREKGTTLAETDVSSDCITYANAGDCRFYRCFQKRFPCDVFGSSHVTDFEFQLCEDLNTQNEYFDYQGRQWTKATNKCLMQKLLPLYRQASVVCIDLHEVLFEDRIDCLVDSGFCGVSDPTHNRWAIDRGTDLASYPALLPEKAGLSMAGREYFYSELSSFRRMMGYANNACHAKGLKQHETFYVRVRTESGYRLMEQN